MTPSTSPAVATTGHGRRLPAMITSGRLGAPGGRFDVVVDALRPAARPGRETYWAFHMRREHYRVHQARYQDRYGRLA